MYQEQAFKQREIELVESNSAIIMPAGNNKNEMSKVQDLQIKDSDAFSEQITMKISTGLQKDCKILQNSTSSC